MAAVSAPNTVTQTSHAMVIRAVNKIIGAVNQWNPTHNRTVTECFEFGVVTPGGGPNGVAQQYSRQSGSPYELIPGNTSGQQIEIARYDLYTAPMELVFGPGTIADYLHMLSDQLTALQLIEAWTLPAMTQPTGLAGNYQIIYDGCWFSRIGRTIQSSGDRIVNVNATLNWTAKTRL